MNEVRAKRKKRLWKILAVLALLTIAALIFGWYKFFREVDQPASITGDPEQNFLYGSIGSESQAGIPYWIVVVLPRIFGDQYLPGPAATLAGLPQEGRSFHRFPRRRSASIASRSTARSVIGRLA